MVHEVCIGYVMIQPNWVIIDGNCTRRHGVMVIVIKKGCHPNIMISHQQCRTLTHISLNQRYIPLYLSIFYHSF